MWGVEGRRYYVSHVGLRAHTCTAASYLPSAVDLHVPVCPYLRAYGPAWLCTCILMDWWVCMGCSDVCSSPWSAVWLCSSASLSCKSSNCEVHWCGCMSEWVREQTHPHICGSWEPGGCVCAWCTCIHMWVHVCTSQCRDMGAGSSVKVLCDGRRDAQPGVCMGRCMCRRIHTFVVAGNQVCAWVRGAYVSACGYMHVHAGIVCMCLCIRVAGGLACLCVQQGVPHVLMGA